jgi:aminoglycoside phosphotransferase (APT) family kinase protein
LPRPWIPLAGPREGPLQAALDAMAGRAGALLHLDYHPLNILCADGMASTVLDWTNATTGEPRADAARTVTLLRLTPAPPNVPPALLGGMRIGFEAAWRSGYRAAGGRLDDMALFYAWAGAMMAEDF